MCKYRSKREIFSVIWTFFVCMCVCIGLIYTINIWQWWWRWWRFVENIILGWKTHCGGMLKTLNEIMLYILILFFFFRLYSTPMFSSEPSTQIQTNTTLNYYAEFIHCLIVCVCVCVSFFFVHNGKWNK